MILGSTTSNLIKRLYQFFHPKSEFNEPIVEIPISLPKNKYLALLRSLLPYNTAISVRERIVENPFVFMNLNLPKGASILDVGCCRSRIAVEMASLGYQVTANDLKSYKYKHPNLTFMQGDLRYIKFPRKFDAITAISTIEHTGLGAYLENKSTIGDMEMIDRIYNLLRKQGKLILTVPFGVGEIIDGNTRVYDFHRLKRLLKKFKIVKMEFYKGLDRKHWIPVNLKELSAVSSKNKSFIQGVVCIVTRRVN